MKTIILVLMALWLVPLPQAWAAQRLDWPELIDPVKGQHNDPFEKLSAFELQSLGQVLRLRQALKAPYLPAKQKAELQSALTREEALLMAVGIDVDGLLAQREEIYRKRIQASLSGNPALEGKLVTLKGFVIPVFGPDGASLGGYLVPEEGMCSHIPPPNPNQMIRYLPREIWAGDYVYQPVSLTGRLKLKLTKQEIELLDGKVEMIAAFEMELEQASPLAEEQKGTEARSFNLFKSGKGLFDRLSGK